MPDFRLSKQRIILVAGVVLALVAVFWSSHILTAATDAAGCGQKEAARNRRARAVLVQSRI